MSDLTCEEERIVRVLRAQAVCSDIVVLVIKAIREEAVSDTERAVIDYFFT